MFLTVFIAFLSLLLLVILHELGHFILARRFGVLVEEFGIGLPPRVWGKKIGETLYSLNLLPLGAFVRLYGEEKDGGGPRSFSEKPVWERSLIVVGGIVSFWIIAAVIFSFLMVFGAPSVIGDDNATAKNPQVQVVGVAVGSPAEKGGMKAGDIVKKLRTANSELSVEKVSQVQEFTDQYKGQEVVLMVQRGREILEVSLVPRIEPPAGEGPMGIALVRVGLISYPWWQAPLRGIHAAFAKSWEVLHGWGVIFAQLFREGTLPPGAQFSGPVGIFVLFVQASHMGFPYFAQLIAVIAIYLAIFNALPIPAVDGGRLFFLCLEAIRRRPMPREFEQKITAAFFLFLVLVLIFVTIKDISRIL